MNQSISHVCPFYFIRAFCILSRIATHPPQLIERSSSQNLSIHLPAQVFFFSLHPHFNPIVDSQHTSPHHGLRVKTYLSQTAYHMTRDLIWHGLHELANLRQVFNGVWLLEDLVRNRLKLFACLQKREWRKVLGVLELVLNTPNQT